MVAEECFCTGRFMLCFLVIKLSAIVKLGIFWLNCLGARAIYGHEAGLSGDFCEGYHNQVP